MNTTAEINEPANTTTARDLAEQMSAKTGLPFTTCWNRVRASHPELFIHNRESQDQEAVAAPAKEMTGMEGAGCYR
jgi:hypothetical protein